MGDEVWSMRRQTWEGYELFFPFVFLVDQICVVQTLVCYAMLLFFSFVPKCASRNFATALYLGGGRRTCVALKAKKNALHLTQACSTT